MAASQSEGTIVRGTNDEQDVFKACLRHYQLARQDLQIRYRYFDRVDILFRSYIDESIWPYRSVVFDPRIVTSLFEKTARNLANKPKGRLLPRTSGDSLGAKINNELLDFQWDDNERVDDMPMLAKWNMMDLNARKYGTSFGLVKWHWQRQVMRSGGFDMKESGKSKIFYDGPNFKPLNNRDCLPNPAYSSVKNWFQYREYVTFQDLQDINDAARGKPIYKNLDLLKQAIQEASKGSEGGGGDTRMANYTMKNLSIRGLSDLLGRDPVYKTVEIITEYRPDRWITFSPRHGVVIRDIPNPYDHGQIPITMLRYYPIDEDIYGLSEVEPVERLQKAINALICQYLDAINMSLYTPIKVRSTAGAVQMHTLEFGPGKKWLMNDPATDVISHEQDLAGVQEFTETYRFLVSAMQEALGETSAGISNLVPGAGDKTATEVKDLAVSRTARDNFNQMFLAEAIQKQMMFWHRMNQQFLFNSPAEQHKIIRITGKDGIRFFQEAGLDANGLDDSSIEALSNENTQNNDHIAAHMRNNPAWTGDTSEVPGFHQTDPSALTQPLYPVSGVPGTETKFSMDDSGQFGKLVIEPEDLEGDYDYIADIASMGQNATDDQIQARQDAITMLTGVDPKTGAPIGVNAMLQQDGVKVKVQDLVEDHLEDLGMRDAEKYFEQAPQVPQQPMMQGGVLNGQAQGLPTQPGGAGAVAPGPASMGNGGVGGVQGGL